VLGDRDDGRRRQRWLRLDRPAQRSQEVQLSRGFRGRQH